MKHLYLLRMYDKVKKKKKKLFFKETALHFGI